MASAWAEATEVAAASDFLSLSCRRLMISDFDSRSREWLAGPWEREWAKLSEGSGRSRAPAACHRLACVTNRETLAVLPLLAGLRAVPEEQAARVLGLLKRGAGNYRRTPNF